jgi:hypothetical protein
MPMARIVPATPEDRAQLALLATPPDEAMSGRIRYAAAMYFYQRGMISEECLEVYRICSRLDREDPVPFLTRVGLAEEVEAMRTIAWKEASSCP